MDSPIVIKRENEFYQGFIRLKMSISNETSFVITDVTLEFFYDENQFQIDHYDPHYKIKNNKVLLDNLNGGMSKSIAVYFDPLMCTRRAKIQCQVNFMDAHGSRSSVYMKEKEISVVCPVMETEFDINVGRLKEFIEKLPSKDSKIYEISHGLNINKTASIAREILEKRSVRHVRTLQTKDGREREIWYYGRTKVTGSDIVIKISMSSKKHLLELFVATEHAETLTGLLAELGRDLRYNIEARATGKGNSVNVTIRESVIQRSNLLDLCSFDGTCPANILIEDSIVQHTNLMSGKGENGEDEKANASIPKSIPYFLKKSVISGFIQKLSFMNLLRNRSTREAKEKEKLSKLREDTDGKATPIGSYPSKRILIFGVIFLLFLLLGAAVVLSDSNNSNDSNKVSKSVPLVFSNSSSSNESSSVPMNLDLGKDLSAKATVECRNDTTSLYGVCYKVNCAITNKGDKEVDFDQLIVDFDGSYDVNGEDKLFCLNQSLALAPGESYKFGYSTAGASDPFLEASEDGKVTLLLILLKATDDDGIIFYRLADLPSIVDKKNTTAQLRPGEVADVEFYEIGGEPSF